MYVPIMSSYLIRLQIILELGIEIKIKNDIAIINIVYLNTTKNAQLTVYSFCILDTVHI